MKNSHRIPLLLRVGPIQLLTIGILMLGGVLGMFAVGGAVLVGEGQFQINQPILAGGITVVMTVVLLLITALIRPLRINLEYQPYNRNWGLLVAWIYIIAGYALMAFNLIRLDVPTLLFESPGYIAFRLTEEHGAVIYYTTMLCFFVGASFALDTVRSRHVKRLIVLSIIVFALGLLATARREMLILIFAWGFIYLFTREKLNVAIVAVLGMIFGGAIFVSTIVFRHIDVSDSPMAYFLSGEFEPYRFALYLVDNWIREGGVFYSPWSFAIPFADASTLAQSTNCVLVQDYLHNSTCLGSFTITVFAAILYFGFAIPVVFYVIAVWCAKQSAHFLEHRDGAFSSFIYAFFLLRLILFVRNGELFDSLIDSIVLAVLLLIFFVATSWKAVRVGRQTQGAIQR
jgi:hypothetical protein